MGDKYSIFLIKGGLGKHVAATAVARSIKNNHPDRKLIVVCGYPSVFYGLDFVYRSYPLGHTTYFYQDYVYNKDTLVFGNEPYETTSHISKSLPLVESWVGMYGLNYNGERPELSFNYTEKLKIYQNWKSEKPILLLHTSGGPINLEENKTESEKLYTWTRDMPYGVAHQVVERFRNDYTIFHVTRPDAYVLDDVVRVDYQMNNMDFFTIVAASNKRLLIDSCLQHTASALNLPSTVLWIGTSPKVFGYQLHNNIVANIDEENTKLIDSLLFNFAFTNNTHQCPFDREEELFDINEIFNSITNQPTHDPSIFMN